MKKDELYEDAKKIVIEDNNARLSNLQRKLFIGYNRTNLIMQQLEDNGVVSKHNVRGMRTVLELDKDKE